MPKTPAQKKKLRQQLAQVIDLKEWEALATTIRQETKRFTHQADGRAMDAAAHTRKSAGQ